ncbi:hypothetical protein [Streptomyces sp. SPB162]|uniref:hypothetical protein n=1 Tax=Streptomyces sp. SPB162 TaxID=2940560 RepID=UPI002404CF3B|nr:hypothetical protein [Streptomyces sp. SPB162]MDF9817223.1 hypothetical protein [Streptomyces sp. SPB162]
MAARTAVKAAPKCLVCKGTGEVAIPVKVGRKQRITEDHQVGMCLTCFGSGQA